MDKFTCNNLINEVENGLVQIKQAIDYNKLIEDKQFRELEMTQSDFYNQLNYQQKINELVSIKTTIERFDKLYQLLEDVKFWADLDAEDEMFTAAELLKTEYEQYKLLILLNGKYDKENVIINLHAGSGGTEAEDWASMVARCIMRWAESQQFKYKIIDEELGDIAGIKSMSIEIQGDYAYGKCKALHGVWRLVRVSPFDAAGRRHTSFMAVDVIPQLREIPDITINPDDIIVETMTAHVKAGGQAMQHNNTAVRITHKPTGIAIRYDVERSQYQNKACALELLKSRLALIEEEKRFNELSDIRGEMMDNKWGSQILSVVLMPYQMVKDHRTEWNTANTTGFLNGEIDELINAYLSK